MKKPLLTLNSPELLKMLKKEEKEATVIVPIASLEWHNGLPLGTDAIIASGFSELLAQQLNCFIAPLLPYGFSVEHKHFKGTISIDVQNFINIVENLIDEFVRNDFARIVIVNGHGGNRGLLESITRTSRRRHPKTSFILIDMWKSLALIIKELFGEDISPSPHAGFFEASVLSYFREDLLADFKRSDSIPSFKFKPATKYSIIPWMAEDLKTEKPIKYSPKIGKLIIEKLLEKIVEELSQ